MIKKYRLWWIILPILFFGGFLIIKEKSKVEVEIELDNSMVNDSEKEKAIEPINKEKIKTTEEESGKLEDPFVTSPKNIDKILIEVPFTPQAPFSKWDERHEEACEEASILMLKYFLTDKELNPQIAEAELQNMIDFQIRRYGDYKDSDAKEMQRIALDFYEIDNLKVIYDFKKDDFKKYLAKGTPIIVPAAGRLLGNPYFTPPGPLYHALILVGFEGNMIITNDPGTRRGERYKYDIDVLYNAIHDFTGRKEDIEAGRKAMLVLE